MSKVVLFYLINVRVLSLVFFVMRVEGRDSNIVVKKIMVRYVKKIE